MADQQAIVQELYKRIDSLPSEKQDIVRELAKRFGIGGKTAGSGKTGQRLKGDASLPTYEKEHPTESAVLGTATATMMGGPILGEAAALIPGASAAAKMSELGSAARQGALSAKAAPPPGPYSPYRIAGAVAGHKLPLPAPMGEVAGYGAGRALQAPVEFAKGAVNYMRQKPLGPPKPPPREVSLDPSFQLTSPKGSVHQWENGIQDKLDLGEPLSRNEQDYLNSLARRQKIEKEVLPPPKGREAKPEAKPATEQSGGLTAEQKALLEKYAKIEETAAKKDANVLAYLKSKGITRKQWQDANPATRHTWQQEAWDKNLAGNRPGSKYRYKPNPDSDARFIQKIPERWD